MHIGNYIYMVHEAGRNLSKALKMVAKDHGDEPDVEETCTLLAGWVDGLVDRVKPFVEKYGEEKNKEPDRLMRSLFKGTRKGSMGLLLDLQDLWLMSEEAQVCATILRQAASGVHDKDLINLCNDIEASAKRQTSWLLTRMKSDATQTLIVAEE